MMDAVVSVVHLTSAIIVLMQLCRPFKAVLSVFAMAAAISSQQAEWAPSTGRSILNTVFIKCCPDFKHMWINNFIGKRKRKKKEACLFYNNFMVSHVI